MNLRSLTSVLNGESKSETWLIRLLVPLLVYLSWAWGGTPVYLQRPLPWLGLTLLFLIFLLPALCRRDESVGKSLAGSAVSLLRDPVFYSGGLFLLLLAAQWWNAGRFLFFNPVHRAWEYTAPGVAWLPSAFSRQDAGEMLAWFFPAWAMILSIRNPRMSPGGVGKLWMALAVNGSILALLGIAQYAAGAPGVFWTKTNGAIFFASFGNANHAGAFFTLMFCLSGALCVHELYSRSSFRWGWKQFLLPAVAFLNLAGATFSLSRVGTILGWFAAIALVIYTVAKGWRRLTPAYRLNLAVALVGALCFAFFVVGGLPGHSVLDELSTLRAINNSEPVLENARYLYMRAAIEIWRESPWFGVGGWGFAYLLSSHIPEWHGHLTPGSANVHNDPLQFLVEFGAVGSALLLATLVALAWPIAGTRIWRHPLVFCTVLGLVLTLIHSLVDLPFRCPAILFSWLAMLSGAGVMCGEWGRGTRQQVVRGSVRAWSVAGRRSGRME